MRWFARKTRRDVWDEVVEGPLGDIEAAARIRAICDAASAISTNSAQSRQRYERAARVAMEIAMKIADDLMRDDAVRRIVDLCMKADDLKTAQILFRAIQAGWIREALQRDHPALSQ